MTWFRVDDGFPSHPKVASLFDGDRGPEALAMWLLAGAWCARELTDGWVPSGQVKRFGLDPSVAAELVRVGLWHTEQAGFRIHDYLHYNPSRAHVMAERVDAAQRKQASRAGLSRDRRAGHSVTPPVTPAVTTAETGVVTPSGSSATPDPDPDPDLPIPDPIPEPVWDARDAGPGTRSLVQQLRADFMARYLRQRGGPPNEAALSKMVVVVGDWIRVAAPLRKLSESQLASDLVSAFFASSKAADNRHAPSFLAYDPSEWLDPPRVSAIRGSGPVSALDEYEADARREAAEADARKAVRR